ncbi:MAG: DUF1565 domain-containing protein [candidate division KSB1 bacterium]|nr:DUF1565 domain-containing protein [candidate division KSB1 bacterium]MDZ7335023.1 DUF1565 domain-containing protein [candidate division KSB1 bacterium]MDZ7357790.1 DUF1565 domain-containing protein [candidate division KSB1 bacterium]MDZ7376765.1 DUF1565 domain-containing protein [candidate division KSB1 bacterium]MDZ7399392.1 DUF1565 domain-containing protein [candidate division KSB1 bacterium]
MVPCQIEKRTFKDFSFTIKFMALRLCPFLMMLCVGMIETPVEAKTYFVNMSNGNDRNSGLSKDSAFKTITKAVSILVAGDSCLVQTGQYPERVEVRQSGRLNQPIVIKADGAVTVRGFNVNGSYIHIIGFEITNTIFDAQNGTGIFLEASFCQIENNYIHDVPRIGIYINAEPGDSPNIANNTVRGNRIYRAATAGIFVAGRNHLIESNDISRTIQYPPGWRNPPGSPDADGIRFFGAGHIIRRNFIHDIWLSDPENIDPHIDCFQTWGPARDIIFEQNFGINRNDGMQGFMISDANGTVSNLTITNNVIIAFRIVNAHNCKGITIVHNTFKSELNFKSESGYGIELHHTTKARIENNLFYDIGQHQYSYLWKDAGSESGLRVGYNAIFMSDGRPPAGTASSHDIWQLDPKLIDPNQYNFRPRPSSPLIDSASASNIFYDFDGIPRPQGSGFDIGAFEYDPIDAPTNVRVRGL